MVGWSPGLERAHTSFWGPLLGTFPKAGKVWEGRPGEDSVEGAMARAGPRPVATLKRSAGVGG